jgi:hypothetical protein
MTALIKRLFAAATIAGLAGWAIPALGQTSDSGVNPTLISGDQSPERIASVCGLSPADVRGQLVLSPPTSSPPPGDFDVDVTVSGDRLAFTNSSTPDQFNGGIGAVGVRRNGTYVYCYPAEARADANLDAPGSGTPNQVTFIFGPGPCPFSDVTTLCGVYNTPERTVDFIQGHLTGTQEVNICGCPPAEANFCDAALPPGTEGSCVPPGQTSEFQGSEFTGSATVGTGTCEQLTTTVGGRLRTITVCK